MGNQRHCTHILCWTMQRFFDWSEHSFWKIRDTRLTCYVGPCKNLWSEHFFSESETLDSHPMLEHSKIIWLIRKFLWEIRGTGLTSYVGSSKDLTNQNISFEKLETLNSHPMLDHPRIIWLIRTFLLRNQGHWTHTLCWTIQRLFDWSEHSFEKLEALYSQPILEHPKIIWLIKTFPLRNQRQ